MMNKKLGKLNISLKGRIPKRLIEAFDCLPETLENPDLVINFSNKIYKFKNPVKLRQASSFLLSDNSILTKSPYFEYHIENGDKLQQVNVFNTRRKLISHLPEFIRRSQYKLQCFCSSDDYLFEKFYVEGFITFCQLAMMQKGQTFLHASCVSNENGAIAFAGIGGSGKSSIEVNLIKNYGFKFLSDDMTPIDEDAIAYYNPRHLTVLPYNVDEVDFYRKLFEEFPLFERFRWNIFKKIWGKSGISKKILPEEIFSNKNIGQGSKLKAVVFIQRYNSEEIKIDRISAQDLAKLSRVVLRQEMQFAINFLTSTKLLFSKNGFSASWLHDFDQRIYDIYEKIFSQTDCYILYLPDNYASSAQAAKKIIDEIYNCNDQIV